MQMSFNTDRTYLPSHSVLSSHRWAFLFLLGFLGLFCYIFRYQCVSQYCHCLFCTVSQKTVILCHCPYLYQIL